MIYGAHVILYSTDASADRAFLRDVLGWPAVDAGHDWLIFALPPAEVAVHAGEDASVRELYLLCDDVGAEVARLTSLGVSCSALRDERWGTVTMVKLLGGGKIGLYQPRHPLALTREASAPGSTERSES